MDNSSSDGLGNFFGSEPSAPASPEPAPALTPAPTTVDVPVGTDPNVALDPALTPPATAQPPAAPVPEPPKPTPTVPLPELLETRHRAQSAEARAREAEARAAAAEQRMQQFMWEALQRQQQPQQSQQPIDPIAEPERWAAALQERAIQEAAEAARREAQTIREEARRERLVERLNDSERATREASRAKHGSDAIVDQALEWAHATRRNHVYLQQPDPWGAMVAEYQAHQLAQTIGSDPAAYEARIRQQERERLMAELKQGRQPSNIPPSITAATNSASAPQVLVSSRDAFNQMMNEPLRKRQ